MPRNKKLKSNRKGALRKGGANNSEAMVSHGAAYHMGQRITWGGVSHGAAYHMGRRITWGGISRHVLSFKLFMVSLLVGDAVPTVLRGVPWHTRRQLLHMLLSFTPLLRISPRTERREEISLNQ